jgi:ABC-type sugar transport system ATPase subunit
MVTDEIEDLRRCDRVLVMYRGRIVRELRLPGGRKPL